MTQLEDLGLTEVPSIKSVSPSCPSIGLSFFYKINLQPPTTLTDLALIGEKTNSIWSCCAEGDVGAASHIELSRLVTLEALFSQSVPGPSCVLTAHTLSDFTPIPSTARSIANRAKLTDKSSPGYRCFPTVTRSREDPPEKDPESCVRFTCT